MKDQRADRDAERFRRASDTGPRGRRDRRQQWRNRLAAVLLVVAVAVVVVVPQLLNRARTENLEPPGPVASAAPPTAAQSGSDPLTANPCPAEPVDVDAASGRSLSPEGVVSVRLCSATAGGVDTPWRPPMDALVTEVDAFLDALGSAPTAAAGRCDAVRVAAEPYSYRVRYPGGRVDVLPVVSICSDVPVDDRAVAANDVLDRFEAALSGQRRTLDLPPSAAVPAARCPTSDERDGQAPSRAGVLDPARLTVRSAVICRYDGEGSATELARLSGRELTSLQADWRQRVTLRASESACGDSQRGLVVVAVSAWGDVVRLARSTGCGSSSWTGDGYSWRPGPAGPATHPLFE